MRISCWPSLFIMHAVLAYIHLRTVWQMITMFIDNRFQVSRSLICFSLCYASALTGHWALKFAAFFPKGWKTKWKHKNEHCLKGGVDRIITRASETPRGMYLVCRDCKRLCHYWKWPALLEQTLGIRQDIASSSHTSCMHILVGRLRLDADW